MITLEKLQDIQKHILHNQTDTDDSLIGGMYSSEDMVYCLTHTFEYDKLFHEVRCVDFAYDTTNKSSHKGVTFISELIQSVLDGEVQLLKGGYMSLIML
jgi:hypothetical protein